MTPAIVAAFEYQQKHMKLKVPAPLQATVDPTSAAVSSASTESLDEPSLINPTLGSPISHTQLISLSRNLASFPPNTSPQPPLYHLADLLRGSNIYRPPAPPRPSRRPSYEALMARLRRDEEARSYARLIAQPTEMTSHASAAGPAQADLPTALQDELTYADASRQVTLIFNILISVLACGVAIWLGAWHWAAPSRLALSMGGGGVIGCAEVAVYWGYLRRVGDAKTREKAKKEKKKIVESWVIEGGKGKVEKSGRGLVTIGDEGKTGYESTEKTARMRRSKRV